MFKQLFAMFGRVSKKVEEEERQRKHHLLYQKRVERFEIIKKFLISYDNYMNAFVVPCPVVSTSDGLMCVVPPSHDLLSDMRNKKAILLEDFGVIWENGVYNVSF